LLLGAAVVAGIGSGSGAWADDKVDVALELGVDVSLSMSPDELEIQQHGYIAALTDDRVIKAIRDGVYGKIAVAYFEWAGWTSQRIVVPWTVIASREDAERVASQLSAHSPTNMRRTSIAGALDFGADLFAESGIRSVRRVIDISGDGSNNQGPPVETMRSQVVAQGITINGLPLMTNGGLAESWDVVDLDQYYANCVIGGAGAFMIPVNDWTQFPEAVRRKLVLDLAGPASLQWAADEAARPRVYTVQNAAPYDCLIGEKLWRDRFSPSQSP
jgi:hypothetical protein